MEKDLEALRLIDYQNEAKKYKYLYQKALENTIKADRENKILKAELKKKDKIVNEMSKTIGIVMTDIKVVKSQFEKEYCDFINSNEECCWKTDSDCTDCIKQYFERKVEDVK